MCARLSWADTADPPATGDDDDVQPRRATHRHARRSLNRCRSSKRSSSASSRASPSSCRSPRAATSGSSRRSSTGLIPGASFTAVIQLGTMAAVVLYFWTRPVAHRHRLAGVAAGPEPPPDLDARLGWYLIIATIPIGIFGAACSPTRSRPGPATSVSSARRSSSSASSSTSPTAPPSSARPWRTSTPATASRSASPSRSP